MAEACPDSPLKTDLDACRRAIQKIYTRRRKAAEKLVETLPSGQFHPEEGTLTLKVGEREIRYRIGRVRSVSAQTVETTYDELGFIQQLDADMVA